MEEGKNQNTREAELPQEKFDRLVQILKDLRSEGGCPWDRAQTHESLIVCLRDEEQEVEEAIEKKDAENLCEELGDLLLQVVFHARLAEEDGLFTISDVLDGINEKMIRRHPHVFGDVVVNTPEESLELWHRIKEQERAGEAPKKP